MAVRLDPGVYYYCRCGLSQTQPWCDGAHKGTDFQPKKLVIDTPQEAYICMCKHTQKSPFCDGAHKKL
jgi:CDGSH-type Zn-finger protein